MLVQFKNNKVKNKRENKTRFKKKVYYFLKVIVKFMPLVGCVHMILGGLCLLETLLFIGTSVRATRESLFNV